MCSGYSNCHSQSNYLWRFTMRQLSSLFQLIISFIAFAFDEYPITSLFVLGVIIYVLYSYTDTPLLVKYAEMQNYI